MTDFPHQRVIVAASLAAVVGYLGFSVWAVLISRDATVIGDVIGTWKSFAVAAFSFWLGSSSGSKAANAAARKRPTGTKRDPVAVEELK